MSWKDAYNARYARPLHLRPTAQDQKIIDRIRAHIASQDDPTPTDSAVIRAALRAWDETSVYFPISESPNYTISNISDIGEIAEIEQSQDQDQDQDH